MARPAAHAARPNDAHQRAIEAANSEALLARADASKHRLAAATTGLLAALSHPVVRREIAAIESKLVREEKK